ncbi:ABC transporter permease subunit [Schleiferilactobacillus harbinensis]|jgi:putative aldouronate transport system permease protein|uniref:Carbohydrate ABC transporter permease n=2 Tax=Schleiferilactobacillus harbinensis TaxID=304207 RepID=A0ABU7SWP6_9LACO|nr:carbohydrate ABC transporter permease [Schleiferilactobacillus harbinensis]KRM29946.1 multiple sugar transport system permease protein [Schleiferilactobacillus harbinensis DSM 16991]MCI1688312.1 carbohydrate ABC transporter permease [Schleiferilactobacillus harbinensis]QFR62919.1 ABC transporter permease subunit [Schleiferilactobacillus harbinensis]
MDMKMYSKFDRHVLVVNRIIIGFLVIITVIPLVYVTVASFMDPATLLNKGISFNPADWTTQGYQRVFADHSIVRGFLNSIFYSFAFSVLTVLVTMLTAYPLSKPSLYGRGPIMMFFVITMFVGGGLIPTYLLIKNLGMLDSVWALIVPGAINVWNIIIARTYFSGLPKELSEAATIDGANEMQIFFKIMLPLAKPIMFVLFLYAFVGQWNSYFDAMIYIKDPNLQPLQLVLRNILIQNQPSQDMVGASTAMAEMKQIAELIKYATIVISSLPLIVMYPFFQKYFDKGVLVGSVKG